MGKSRISPRRISPGTLGNIVTAVTNMMLAFLLLHTRGVNQDTIIVGMLWFTGGLGSWIAAVLEYIEGHGFEFTVFASFGAFYCSFATTMTPAFSIRSSYASIVEFDNAMGLLFLTWSFLFLLFAVSATRTNAVLLGTFISVTITAILVSASYFTAAINDKRAAVNLQKAAGIFLLFGAFGGWYSVARSLFGGDGLGWNLPLGDLGESGEISTPSILSTRIKSQSRVCSEVPKIDIDFPSKI